MRFRARLARDGVTLLLNIFGTMSSISTNALILLEPDYFRVSVLSESIENPRGYLEVASAEFFAEFRVESQSENRIAFEVPFAMLCQALSSGKTSSHAVLKLSKRTDGITALPCLAVVLDSQDSMYGVNVIHDVPIQLLRVADVLSLVSQPNISPPHVALALPKRKLLKTIVDRLCKLGRVVHLTARQEGRLSLQVDTSGANILTQLSSLAPRLELPNQHITEVTVSAKKLVCLLDYHNIPHSDAALCFSPREALVLFLELQPARLGSLTFYLPVLLSQDDWPSADGAAHGSAPQSDGVMLTGAPSSLTEEQASSSEGNDSVNHNGPLRQPQKRIRLSDQDNSGADSD